MRDQEFGSAYPMAIVPGPREVLSSFTLFAQPDAATQSLYAAAKSRTPISALFQLGQQKGQMMAIYLPNVVPELPLFDDSEPYLLWEFKNNLVRGYPMMKLISLLHKEQDSKSVSWFSSQSCRAFDLRFGESLCNNESN